MGTGSANVKEDRGRSRITMFIIMTSICMLVSFRVSSKLMKAATVLTTRIRHEQSRQTLLMKKVVANYSAQLDAVQWKGAKKDENSLHDLKLENEHLRRENSDLQHRVVELTNMYNSVRSKK
ncbi:hypothetical protein AAMO2058_000232100 [Amorphochlora amoebiformis]